MQKATSLESNITVQTRYQDNSTAQGQYEVKSGQQSYERCTLRLT